MEAGDCIAKRYYGRILNGDYSDLLKDGTTDCIHRFAKFDEMGIPTMPYISAWQETEKAIWYEFISQQLIQLLGCHYEDAPQCFRSCVQEQRKYTSKTTIDGLRQEILKNNEVEGQKKELREEVLAQGMHEAVYKLVTADQSAFWIKDQAILESYPSDGIHLSLGNLTVVTKEMEAEEKLKETQKSLRKSEQKYREQAIHDNLTNLYNTRYLYQSLSNLINEHALKRKPFSLIFMDMDNFKKVVDANGHLNASRTLQEVAATIQKALSSPAYGVAYGGDEFVLVLPGQKKQQAINLADAIRLRIKETVYLKKLGLNVCVSASFGVATFPDDATTLTDLLALADQAMFSVKAKGKDSVCGISWSSSNGASRSPENVTYDCNDEV